MLMVLVKKLSNTATAVVDTITENTPITKANNVSIDRSLFASSESVACLNDSVNCIFIQTLMIQLDLILRLCMPE